MADLTTGARCLVSFVGRYFGQRTITTFLYKCVTVSAGTDQKLAVERLLVELGSVGGLIDKYAAVLPGNDVFTFSEIWGQVIYPVRYRKVVIPSGTSPVGDYASTTANVSAAITRQGERAGRRYTGGVRIPAPTSKMANGLIDTGYRALLQDLANEIKLPQTTTTPAVTWQPQVGLPGRRGNPPVPVSPVESVDCFYTEVKDTTRVMRRRTVGLGE